MLHVKKSILFFYALPALPLAFLTTPVYIFLPAYYGETLGIGLGTVGVILLLARLWDMVSDLAIGIASDRSKSTFGRRHLFVATGLPLTMLSAWFLLVPQTSVGALYLLFWSCLLYLGWTMMILPLNALGAELSKDYHERTRISGWREAFTVCGVLVCLFLIALLGFTHAEQARSALYTLAITTLILLPVTTILFLVFVPRIKTLSSSMPTRRNLKILLMNKPFCILVSAYLLNGLANGLPATLFLLFVTHVLGLPNLAGPILFIYFLCGVISVPFWSLCSRYFGKNKSWSTAMVLSCIFFALVPFIGEGDQILFITMSVLTGLCLGADLALPSSMQADVIDIDRAYSGEDRAGLFFALWGMATKLALALAAGLALPAIEWLGFTPSSEILWPIILFYSTIPIAFKMAAIALMRHYTLEQADIAVIQKHLPTV